MGLRLPFLLVLLAASACGPEAPPARLDRPALQADWRAWVAARDSLFRSEASPLPAPQRAGFGGLPYFAYDSAFAVPAALVPTLEPDTLAFPTTTGELRPMATAGHLVFEAGGVQRRLEAFRPLDAPGRLFVPFRDGTSGDATYGGGRYLDLDVPASGQLALDLNRAYHPYCVYDASYSCPLPPAENTLEVSVTAGERLPEAGPPEAGP